MRLQMIEVTTPEHKKEFLDFPKRLNAHDPEYIVPLDKDIEEVFDSQKNKTFRFGECVRWLCVDESGNTVGKVATFVNKKYAQSQPTGGIGFFDCIHDKNVSRFMFDHCKKWLAERGMEAMDGPINFGERDKWWGLLIEGFKQPLYGMNYNPPYYKELFEDYGFEVYFYQLCFGRLVHSPLSPSFENSHNKIAKVPGIRIECITKKNLMKYAEDFTEVYNKAWASHGQGKQLDVKVAKKMFSSMRPVMDENISFIVYEYNKPIAIWVNIPDLNQWFKFLKGKFSLWHKLKFLWIKTTKANPNLVGMVFGIVPEWQKKGVDGYIIYKGTEHIRKHTQYQYYEMQWIGDFNPKMVSFAKTLETKVTRKLATYRYLFDRNKPFERHPFLH